MLVRQLLNTTDDQASRDGYLTEDDDDEIDRDDRPRPRKRRRS
jgi:hypothetical protein